MNLFTVAFYSSISFSIICSMNIKLSPYLPSSSYAQKWKWKKGFSGGSDDKESANNAGDLGLIPGSRRSPGERKAIPLQYSCLENSMDRVAWWSAVYEVARSQTWLKWLTRSLYFQSVNSLMMEIASSLFFKFSHRNAHFHVRSSNTFVRLNWHKFS